MSGEDLLNVFFRACAQAGISNSGLVMSFSASDDINEASYFKGVVLARLEGAKPPFRRDDVVRLNSDAVVSLWNKKPSFSPDEPKKIERIYYTINQRNRERNWLLRLDDGSLFDARYFVLASPPMVTI